MANNEPKARLQNALSYRAKATRLRDNAAQALADGKIDQYRFDSLQEYYARHIQSAENQLTLCRAEVRQEVDHLNARLEVLQGEQKELVSRAGKGGLSPAQANEKNRRLVKEIQTAKERVSALSALLSANKPSDVGGPVDMPLEEYGAPARQGRNAKPAGRAFSWRSVVLLVAVGAAGLTAVFAFLLSRAPEPGQITFEASMPDPAGGIVQFTFKNDYASPAQVYVPWPSELGARQPASFGLMLYVRERGQQKFRAWPAKGDWWGDAGERDTAIEVAPGLEVPITLDLRRLTEGGVDAEAVRIDFGLGDGQVLNSFELDVPQDMPPIARPNPRAQERLGPAAATPSPAQKPAITTPPVPAPPQAEAELSFRYTGLMGGKAAIIVIRQDQPQQRRFALPGDEIAEGWTLEKIDATSDSIIVRHDRPKREVTIQRGKSAALQGGGR